MPKKETVLDVVRFVPETGLVQAIFKPRTVYEDGEVQEHTVHIMTIYPGTDPDVEITANNEHFERGVMDSRGTRKYATIKPDDAAAIKAMVAVVHTPDKIAEHKARLLALDEEQDRTKAKTQMEAAPKPSP